MAIEPAKQDGREILVLADQAAALYRNAPTALIGNLFVSSLLVLMLPESIPAATKYVWLSLVYGLTALRFGLWARYRRVSPPPAMAPKWLRRSTLGSLISGLLWGAAGVALFVPGQLEYKLLLLFALLGMTSSAVHALSAHLPAFYAFFIPSLVPIIIMLSAQGGTIGIGLALITVVYAGVTSVFANTMHRTLSTSLNLRYENIELVEDLKRQRDEVERATLAKSRFLATASHDLRQPMHALGLFMDNLRAESAGRPRTLATIDRIEESIDATRGLLDALLDMSRLEAGVIRKQECDFQINSVLQRTAMLFNPLAQQHGLRFTVVPCAAIVRSDPTLLVRILNNLVDNAIKYTADGGVLVGCRRRGARLAVEVWDTGPGIAQEHLSVIFQEFHQLHNPERDRQKGLGFGLAIVERVCRLLDHDVVVRSRVGKGSMFAVELPFGDADAVVPDKPLVEQVGSNFVGTRVCVVDDELPILEGMRELLQGWGCEVITVTSGAELQQSLAGSQGLPDMLISDYRLRDNENGLELIRGFQQQFGRSVPVILITGDTAADCLREADASQVPLLHKPIAPAKLRQLMRQLLRATPASH